MTARLVTQAVLGRRSLQIMDDEAEMPARVNHGEYLLKCY